jgi:hypothetical protein
MSRRVALLLLAGAFGVAALLVSRAPTLALPGLSAWSARHPEPRVLSPESERTLDEQLDGERRHDALLLLCALAAGCSAVALRPRLAAWAGSAPAAVLLAGSVGLGVFQLAASAAGQVRGVAEGSWSVADDTLDRMAPAQADLLRQWRQRIAPDEAVILIGSDPALYDLMIWALHPRPLYPMLLEIRPDTSVDEVLRGARALRAGRQHPARWIVDLGVLRHGAASAHPPLIEVID